MADGPVAQFKPKKAGFRGKRAQSAARASVPSSMEPALSTVICTPTGRLRPMSRNTLRQASMAARDSS